MVSTTLVDALSPPPPWLEFAILATLLGACMGSFLNLVAWRLPREDSVVWPSSHCTRCGTTLQWWENIPVLSWVGLRGRCRTCHTSIGLRHPAVEALCAGLWVLMLVARPPGLGSLPSRPLVAIAGFGLVSLLLLLALIDLDQLWIPEPLCRWAVVMGWLVTGAIGWLQSPEVGRTLLASHLVAAALGLLGFEVLGLLATRLLGRPALGSGDGKVAALLGAWLGPTGLALAVVIAVVSAALVGVLALATGAVRRHQPIPFVPFLALGGLVLWVSGPGPWLRLLPGT
ncbi:MAG: prepilin peptidase [Cyanobacteriota bacterium]